MSSSLHHVWWNMTSKERLVSRKFLKNLLTVKKHHPIPSIVPWFGCNSGSHANHSFLQRVGLRCPSPWKNTEIPQLISFEALKLKMLLSANDSGVCLPDDPPNYYSVFTFAMTAILGLVTLLLLTFWCVTFYLFLSFPPNRMIRA
jgi:hypothetical protein